MYDLIIIGLGPAGFNAALYAKRAGLNVLVIEKESPGGTLNKIANITNMASYEKVGGPELAMNLYKQFKTLGIPLVNEEVLDIKEENNLKTVITHNARYEAKAVIIASGRGIKKLSLGLDVAGVSYCALCDANFYQDKTVAVLGNNPKAIEEALYLNDIAQKVYLVINDDKVKAPKGNIELLNNSSIEIIFNEELVDIINEEKIIKEIVLKEQNLKIDGLFINLGYGPLTYFCESLDILNEEGYIKVNDSLETQVKGIYACGDIIQKEVYQIITALSEGAVAAIRANKYIKNIHD